MQLSVAEGESACAAASPAAFEHCRVVFRLPAAVVHTGSVLSRTVTVFEVVAIQLWLSFTVRVRENVLLQLAPAVTVILCPFAGPDIVPFPDILHE